MLCHGGHFDEQKHRYCDNYFHVALFKLFDGDKYTKIIFNLQQPLFDVEASGIARKRAVGADHTVTGDDDGDGVAVHRLADGLGRPATDTSGDLAIAHRCAIRDG